MKAYRSVSVLLLVILLAGSVPVAVSAQENTMHVEDIVLVVKGSRLVMMVQVADQDGMPLADVMVEASIWMPMAQLYRWRYTRMGGWARFWAPFWPGGHYGLCVNDLNLHGYIYNPDDNGHTCRTWG